MKLQICDEFQSNPLSCGVALAQLKNQSLGRKQFGQNPLEAYRKLSDLDQVEAVAHALESVFSAGP